MSLRALVVVTHLLGAGHLTRAAAIARALAEAGHDVTLVSGGMPTRLVSTRGVRLVQLPPVRAANEEFRGLLDASGREADPDQLARRRGELLDAFAALRPDVVITELFPFGRRALAAEFEALLEAAEAARPRPLVLASVRDILVAPSEPAKIDAAHRRLDRFYDVVLVHADPGLVRLENSWPLPERIASRLVYTGYVDAPEPARPGADAPLPPVPAGTVLVSGGSSVAALPLCRAAIAAASLDPHGRPWRILVGWGVPEDDLAALAAAAPPNAVVERARPDIRDGLGRAALFVGLAGYNTVLDILATAVPAVLVPFERGRETEQSQRAAILQRHGLATLLPEAELSGARLLEACGAATDGTGAVRPTIRRDGAARTAALVAELVATRGTSRPAA